MIVDAVVSGLPVTSLYAGGLGFILLALSLRVVHLRMAHEVSLGDGGCSELLVAQRQQGNFVEYAPFALLLIGLLEAGGLEAWGLHALGASLVAARILHPFGLAPEFGLRGTRVVGSTATWAVLAISSALLVWRSIA